MSLTRIRFAVPLKGGCREGSGRVENYGNDCCVKMCALFRFLRFFSPIFLIFRFRSLQFLICNFISGQSEQKEEEEKKEATMAALRVS